MRKMELPRRYSKDPEYSAPLPRRFDSVVMLGDLNYRVDESQVEVRNCLLIKKFEVRCSDQKMLAKDQLTAKMAKGAFPFNEFTEQPITFAPSYRFKKDTNEYDYKRLPAFTDRVLTSGCSEKRVEVLNYESNVDVKWGDHKPVFAQIEIRELKVKEGEAFAEQATSHCCLL